jgi:hypothetical protein
VLVLLGLACVCWIFLADDAPPAGTKEGERKGFGGMLNSEKKGGQKTDPAGGADLTSKACVVQ